MRPSLHLVCALSLSLAAAACSKPATTPADKIPGAPEASDTTASAPSASDQAALTAAQLATLPAPYNTGDIDNGRTKFVLCMACHSIQAGAPSMTGPNLHGVFGRKAGTFAGYAYSDAVKNSGFVWDAPLLDKWLSQPAKTLPGTKMTFVGLPNAQDRIDLIAYLKVASSAGL